MCPIVQGVEATTRSLDLLSHLLETALGMTECKKTENIVACTLGLSEERISKVPLGSPSLASDATSRLGTLRCNFVAPIRR